MQYRVIAFLFTFLTVGQITAQTNGNSPYSRFGIGDLTDEHFMHMRAMAGLGSSYVDGYHINIVNPASLASLRATAFDLGINATRSTLTSGEATSTAWRGNLQYLSLAFPLKNSLNDLLEKKKSDYSLGMALTLMPNSTVGYNIESEETVEGFADVTRRFRGEGGSYKFLWGNAIKYKRLSFGVNLGYLFGNIKYSQSIEFQNVPSVYQNVIDSDYGMQGFLFDAGAMYMITLNQKQLESEKTNQPNLLSIGARLKNATRFNTNLTETTLAIQRGTTTVVDTAFIAIDQEGKGRLPVEMGFGATYYHGQKYMVGFDFSTANWSAYKNEADPSAAKNPLKNSMDVSLGGYFRPDYKSYNKYYKRVYYRYGAYYRKDPRVVEGSQLDSYGLTLGLGLPFIYQRKISHANLGLELGRKGNGSVIEENFFTISVGFTFNDDEWFLKRKYN